MAVKNGSLLLVYWGASGQTGTTLIACSTNCTLNITQGLTDSTCKDAGVANWNSSIAGEKEWTVDVDGLYQYSTANGFVEIADLILDATGEIYLVIGEKTNSGDISWVGNALCTSCSLSGPQGESATWSASFKGVGAPTKTTL